jgi:hypothetical protein
MRDKIADSIHNLIPTSRLGTPRDMQPENKIGSAASCISLTISIPGSSVV